MPSNLEALAITLLAVVPGFLATTTWARAKTWKGPSNDFRTVLQSVAISALIQLVLLPYTLAILYPVRDHLQDHPRRVALFLVLAVLVVPLAGGRLLSGVSDWVLNPRSTMDEGLGALLSWLWKPSPPPSIWDWMFTTNALDRTFLVVEFSDGKKVAGVFAAGSVALTSPEPPGLFLVQEWGLTAEGDLTVPVPGSMGLMINSGANIRSIRVLGEAEDGGA